MTGNTFIVKVTDSSGRESTAVSLTITTANPGPRFEMENTVEKAIGSISLIARNIATVDIQRVYACCVGSSIPSHVIASEFTDYNGRVVPTSEIVRVDGCFSSKIGVSIARIAIDSSRSPNGGAEVSIRAANTPRQFSESQKLSITFEDPG